MTPETPEDPGRLPHRRLRVVVVDDSAVALRSICSVVEALPGFEIVGAATRAPAGLALAETLQPDLVLLDLRMPDLSGSEIAERLTRQFPAMRVIIVSVHDTAETQRLARLSGAHGFVSKRQLATELPAAVASALAGDSAGAELASTKKGGNSEQANDSRGRPSKSRGKTPQSR